MIPWLNHYRIFASLHAESREGWVWLPQCAHLTSHNVRISSKGRAVVCERRIADKNFRRVYEGETNSSLPDDNFIVISQWYRDRLGIFSTRTESTLLIEDAKTLKASYVDAFLGHPSPIVRVSITLGLVSAVLGIIGVAEGIISLYLARR
jgi:hypothetical protein